MCSSPTPDLFSSKEQTYSNMDVSDVSKDPQYHEKINSGFRARFARAFGSSGPDSRNKLRKKPSFQPSTESTPQSIKNASLKNSSRSSESYFEEEDEPPRTLEQAKKATAASNVDRDTGERRDITGMLHSLVEVRRRSYDSISDTSENALAERGPPSEVMILVLESSQIRSQIAAFASVADFASLAFSCKTLRSVLGSEPWQLLDDEANRQARIDFLVRMDRYLPDHLFCFPCATYHLRIHKGRERLRASTTPDFLLNCPNRFNVLCPPPRIRLTPRQKLPFSFVQLALRAHRYGPDFGIPCQSLECRWTDRGNDWSHQSRYVIYKDRLYLRVISSCWASPGLTLSEKRSLLFSREDYTPYFSVCGHWQNGELMRLCKCALNHIPVPPSREGFNPLYAKITRQHTPSAIINLCGECRPIRRCPQCPTEYMIEIKLAEDKSDLVKPFKHKISLTRWSDLGNGKTPLSREWAACCGETESDNFPIGRRAISTTFEAQFSDTVPAQRVLDLNPKNERKGEAGNDWY